MHVPNTAMTNDRIDEKYAKCHLPPQIGRPRFRCVVDAIRSFCNGFYVGKCQFMKHFMNEIVRSTPLPEVSSSLQLLYSQRFRDRCDFIELLHIIVCNVCLCTVRKLVLMRNQQPKYSSIEFHTRGNRVNYAAAAALHHESMNYPSTEPT